MLWRQLTRLSRLQNAPVTNKCKFIQLIQVVYLSLFLGPGFDSVCSYILSLCIPLIPIFSRLDFWRIINMGIQGIRCQNVRDLGNFLGNWALNFFHFWMILESNMGHYVIFGPRVYPMGSILVRLSVCLSVIEYLRDCPLVFLKLCMKLGFNKVKKVMLTKFWKKNLNAGIKGIKYQNLGFLEILKFLDFCMMVEDNRAHHLSIMPYLEKILICH